VSHRLPSGGLVDRDRPLRFEFDGVELEGLAGDTLASALLANGISGAWRSLYRDRPRGIVSAGREEPGALVQVERDGVSEPMLRATEVELVDGLRAWPLAGRGRLVDDGDDDARGDHVHAHCDVLVVGGGPAGLAAADAAAATGARVILVDERPYLGGALVGADEAIGGARALDWVAEVRGRLAGAPEVRVLRRSTAIGLYDAGYAVVVERRAGFPDAVSEPGRARERLWHVRARRVVLATGASERPIAFADNDRPGVMLAGAARDYVRRFGVAPGRRAVLFTTNDSAYGAAVVLADAGIEVAAVVDARDRAGETAQAAMARRAIPVRTGHVVVGTRGEDHLASVAVAPRDAPDEARELAADLLLVSGGWNPTAELLGHAGGRLRYAPELAAFVPDTWEAPVHVAGACAGQLTLDDCLAQGAAAGAQAAARAGFDAGAAVAPPSAAGSPPAPAAELWLVEDPGRSAAELDTHFVDLQRDVTVADVCRATGAGLRSPEHVKRFTTLGTGNDQGRTAGVLGLGVLASVSGVALDDLAPTSFRPPTTPVSFALLAGRDRGELHDPVRTTAMHPWHVAAGAVFEDVGQWKRPWFYPRAGEDLDAAVLRECAAVRDSVGAMDASTLGKIDVHGPDAATFLNRLYTGDFSKLAVGACKYGILCDVAGMVFDDGVTMRVAEDRYLVTTTTGNAAAVLDWFEEWLQTEWPQLRVHCTSVTEQWATVAIAGPRSRDVLAALAPGLAVDGDGFPFMAIREARVAGIDARVCRVSFSGELAFEVNVASWHGLALWEAVMAAGEPFAITPYGTETMHVLRAEKGYFIVGQDTDGTVTPQDLGYGWAVSRAKGDFVGRRSHHRPDALREDRKQLVALVPDDGRTRVEEGTQVTLAPGGAIPVPMLGHVTSSYRSAALGRPFALALVRGGRARVGETVHLAHEGEWVPATVRDPVLYDPEGLRRDG
jgi:sarcosine oxidase subunit alpha